MRAMRGGLAIVAVLLAFVFPMAALAECGPENLNCAFAPPQSVEVNPNPASGEGQSVELGDPGVFQPIQIRAPMPAPARLTPVPFSTNTSSGGSQAPGEDEILDVPMRYQEAGDVTCGVQALGMAMDGLGPTPGLRTGGEGAASSAILSFLRDNGMMYSYGTGVEELAYAAQSFGYEGTVPFHGWGMEELQRELAASRSVVVSLGANPSLSLRTGGEHEPGHMVTVTGVSADGGWVYYNDPTLGKQALSRAEFDRLWGSQGNSGVAVRKEVPANSGESGPTPWVALAAGLMAAVSGAGLGSLRQGVGGALMGSSSAAGKKKKAKNYNDDGGTMSLKEAYKSGKVKKGKKKSKKNSRKKSKKKQNSSHGGGKAHAKIMPQEGEPPEQEPTATQVPTGTAEPEEQGTGTPEPEWRMDNMISTADVNFPPPIRAPHPPGHEPEIIDIELPDVEGGWISRGGKAIKTALKIYSARALHFKRLDSGYVNVVVDDAIEVGKKLSYREDYGFFGTRYAPSTVARITGETIWSGAKSNLSLGITLAATTGANLYDYQWGEHRDEGLKSSEFVASTVVDFGIAGLTGLAAAGMVAGGIALLGASVPVTAAIAATAVLGLGIGALVDSLVDVEGTKEGLADGLDAWEGIADNAGVILDAAGEKAREPRIREIQEGLYPRHR